MLFSCRHSQRLESVPIRAADRITGRYCWLFSAGGGPAGRPLSLGSPSTSPPSHPQKAISRIGLAADWSAGGQIVVVGLTWPQRQDTVWPALLLRDLQLEFLKNEYRSCSTVLRTVSLLDGDCNEWRTKCCHSNFLRLKHRYVFKSVWLSQTS